MVKKTRFGLLLKRYRQAAGLSQEALAERAELSPRAISDLERGVNRSPRYVTLELLAHALALSSQQRDFFRAIALDTAPASSDTHPTRNVLPIPPARMIGREKEHVQAMQLFQAGKTRLLSIIGPSGVGKTRLAIQIAQDLAPVYSDGVVFIPLAAIRDAALVPNTVAQHLGIQEIPGHPIPEQVQAFLYDQSLLLVLDNLEQLMDSSPFIARLLETCPHIAILATSRSPLRLRAETELLLAPLPLKDAAALFIERAQAIQPSRDYPQLEVAAICEQLDCLPLAIELAAMQVRLFAMPDLQQQLAHRFRLLRSGTRDLPARQQTMKDAIAWSYDLLSEPQQRCFRALGCFVGGWTLAAAEKVCFEKLHERKAHGQAFSTSSEEELDDAEEPSEVLDIFATLVENSLVQTEQVDEGTVRFSMLELIREYALIQLRAAGEMAAVQRRHACYYANLAEQAQAMFVAGSASPNLSLIQEQYNVQAAMQWAEAHHEAVLGHRLSNYTRLWHMSGQFSQAESWMERMLALDRGVRTQGMPSVPLSLRIDRLSGFARILLGHGKYARAETIIAEALQLIEESSDPLAAGQAWTTQGMIKQTKGRLAEAEQAYLQAQRFSKIAGDDQLLIQLYVSRAEIARAQSRLPQAATLLKEALDLAKSVQGGWNIAIITTLLGLLANQQRDFPLASAYLREGLNRLRAFGSPIYIAWCLEGCAVTLFAAGKEVQAVRLCAAAVHIRQKAGSPLPPAELQAFEQVTRNLQANLSQQIFSKEWELGSILSQEEAIELALASLD